MVLLCFAITACSESYEYTNGIEDYTLQTITDENIMKLNIGASGLTCSTGRKDIVPFNGKYSSGNYNGVDRIFHYPNFDRKSEFTVTINNLNVKSGNFKIVIINNEKIICEAPLNIKEEQFNFENIVWTFSIHIAGENAEFELKIDII